MSHWIHFNCIDSTNAYLQRLQAEGQNIDGYVVWTDFQTQGKGMGKNIWESEKGQNLTFSLAFDMGFLKASAQFLLSQAVPMGILSILDQHVPNEKLWVKWPNDIHFNGRKLGGILINSTICGDKMGKSIIGLGLNVNQMKFSNLPTNPISLHEITGKEWDKDILVHDLVDAIAKEIVLLKDSNTHEALRRRYLERLLRYHEWGNYEVNGKPLRLFLDGIDSFGRLMLHDANNAQHLYEIKQIRFLF